MSLYWKVVLVNGAVFCLGSVALALSPASVSSRVLVSEALVLGVGLTVMLVTNALLLRSWLSPVDRLVREMDELDQLEPGRRLSVPPPGPGAVLVQSFNQMLDRLETERATSNARVLAAQEAERQRVAQELHDQVGQSLTVVLLGLKEVQDRVPDELVGELELVRESARAGLDDVRRVARELRPGVLHDLGLHSALAALVTDFSALGGPRVRRTFGPGLPSLPPETELVVYRVAQEALTNAARHAHARQVELSLTRVGGSLVLQVSDDGDGAAKLRPGSGLRGMQERAALVGGRLDLTSAPGRGTSVRLEVPVGG